jgi:spore coat polysaccharide biosynthesis protein SpsF (cytidylyltransferase family)
LLVKQIVKKIKNRPIVTKDIIEILNNNPEIQKINSKVTPKPLEQD